MLEAVSFFVSAFEFGFLQAMIGVRQMLNLVWSGEPTVKDAVVAAYKRLYIDNDHGDPSAAAIARAIARNFMALVTDATVGELASLEELVCMLVASEDIGRDVFQVREGRDFFFLNGKIHKPATCTFLGSTFPTPV